MFLNQLSKKEKVLFLQLAHFIARVDNDFSDKEKEIIKLYCLEMQIDDIEFDENSFDLDKVLNEIKSKRSQKIFLLEIMALIYSDEILHEKEAEVIDLILKKFEIDAKIAAIYAEWTKSILALYRQGTYLLEI
jgi:hypothetical protein